MTRHHPDSAQEGTPWSQGPRRRRKPAPRQPGEARWCRERDHPVLTHRGEPVTTARRDQRWRWRLVARAQAAWHRRPHRLQPGAPPKGRRRRVPKPLRRSVGKSAALEQRALRVEERRRIFWTQSGSHGDADCEWTREGSETAVTCGGEEPRLRGAWRCGGVGPGCRAPASVPGELGPHKQDACDEAPWGPEKRGSVPDSDCPERVARHSRAASRPPSRSPEQRLRERGGPPGDTSLTAPLPAHCWRSPWT